MSLSDRSIETTQPPLQKKKNSIDKILDKYSPDEAVASTNHLQPFGTNIACKHIPWGGYFLNSVSSAARSRVTATADLALDYWSLES
jgi:hypothetical protein